MATRYLYLFNIIASAYVGYVGFQGKNNYILLSCIFTFLISLYCLITSFRHVTHDQNSSEKSSPLTKVLIKKTLGGRKQYSKFEQSAFEKDDKKRSHENNSEKRSFAIKTPMNVIIALVGAGIVVLSFIYGQKTIPYFFKDATADKKSYLSKDEVKPIRKEVEYSTKVRKSQKPQVISPKYSDKEIRKVVERVLAEKEQRGSFTNAKYSKVYSNYNSGYQYEIKLNSGVVIYTDNIQVKDDKISYTWENGLVVSINEEDIQSFKRTPKTLIKQ